MRRAHGPVPSNVCARCRRRHTQLPYRCKFCGGYFCPDHHLPENHNCGGLEKAKRWRLAPPPIPYRPPYRPWHPPPRFPRYPPPRRKEKAVKVVRAAVGVALGACIALALVGVGIVIWEKVGPTVSSLLTPPSAPPPSASPGSGISSVPGTSPYAQEVLPSGYYAKAESAYNQVTNRDIQALHSVLMSDSCKLPAYVMNDFDCSDSSARLEWVLEGHGFDAYLAMGPLHVWVMVKLDGGSWVAIEATYLTSTYYCPPGIIEGPNGEWREHSYLYQMYLDYVGQYDPNLYVLPKSYDDFLQNYLAYVPEQLVDHYSSSEIYGSPEGAIRGTGAFYYPVTEFDWWNHSAYAGTFS